MNTFIDYNTNLQTGDIYAFGPEKQDGYTACHHHHQGQNRPPQKTITHPHAAPSASEGIQLIFGSGRGSHRLSPPPCLWQIGIVQRALALGRE